MSITSYVQTKSGNVTHVTVTSDLVGTVYYHWYIDGAYVGFTLTNSRTFLLDAGDQVRIDVNDTTSEAYDALANAPAGWPARRSIFWIRSTDADVDRYRVEQKKGAGSWVEIAQVRQGDDWSFVVLSPRLDDLSSYTWQIVPVDAAGNDGTAFTIGPETVVRTPDSPNFDFSFDEGTTKVTFSEAA